MSQATQALQAHNKRLNHYRQAQQSGFLPQEAVQHLINYDSLKEYVHSIPPEKKNRILAFLCTFNPARRVAEMCGVSVGSCKIAATRHKDIMEAATMGRNMAIAGLAEQRAIELLVGLDPTAIAQDKKPQAIKYLVDSADIANQHIITRAEPKEDNTLELVFSLKRKMSPQTSKSADVIDVTEDIVTNNKEVKTDDNRSPARSQQSQEARADGHSAL